MQISANTNYQNASLLFKILFWLSVVSFGFVLFHFIMIQLEFYPQAWIRELHFTLQNGIPLFLFLTGTFIRNKSLRIPMILFFATFFIAYALNTLDSWGVLEIRNLKWILGPSLLGLLITYLIHFFKKEKKGILDFLKLLWFLCIAYTQLCILFSVISFKPFWFFEASTYLEIVLMSVGLFRFYRNTN